MRPDSLFPETASPLWLLGTFAAFLLVFHIALLGPVAFLGARGIGKKDLKYIDYLWLGIAALGLFGAAGDVRRLVAPSAVEAQRARLIDVYGMLRGTVQFMTGPAVCHTFVRTQFSPPDFADIQKQYDEVCRFASELYGSLPDDSTQRVDHKTFGERPTVTDRILIGMFKNMDQLLNEYAESKRAYEKIVAAQQRSEAEKMFAIVWPLLLAVALALRVTKVSVEIWLETF